MWSTLGDGCVVLEHLTLWLIPWQRDVRVPTDLGVVGGIVVLESINMTYS